MGLCHRELTLGEGGDGIAACRAQSYMAGVGIALDQSGDKFITAGERRAVRDGMSNLSRSKRPSPTKRYGKASSRFSTWRATLDQSAPSVVVAYRRKR